MDWEGGWIEGGLEHCQVLQQMDGGGMAVGGFRALQNGTALT